MRWAALLLAATLWAAVDANADPLLREWIARQAEIRSLRAEFEQTRRLPALRLPLRKSGTVWLDSRSRFRWQAGDPPELVAIGSPEQILLIDPRKKRARILKTGSAGGALRFDMVRLPFAESYKDFEDAFDVLGLSAEESTVDVLLRPKGPAAAGVKSIRVVFRRSDGVVELFELDLRDGGQISTVMKSVDVNPALPRGLFEFDPAGYTIDDPQGGGR